MKSHVRAIPSRIEEGGITCFKSEEENDRFREFCIAEGAMFLDTREILRNCNSPTAREGEYFSKEGAETVGVAIMKKMTLF